MDGGGKRNCVYPNLRTRPYYDRRCKNKINLSNLLTNIDSLPDELVFLILLELTGHEIYESALFVCRKWYHMVHTDDFVHAHLQHSTPGLLISNGSAYGPTFLTLRGGLEMFKLRGAFTGMCGNTFNGLLLRLFKGSGLDIFTVNPATKQTLGTPIDS